jgi:hypothetical protein
MFEDEYDGEGGFGVSEDEEELGEDGMPAGLVEEELEEGDPDDRYH